MMYVVNKLRAETHRQIRHLHSKAKKNRERQRKTRRSGYRCSYYCIRVIGRMNVMDSARVLAVCHVCAVRMSVCMISCLSMFVDSVSGI